MKSIALPLLISTSFTVVGFALFLRAGSLGQGMLYWTGCFFIGAVLSRLAYERFSPKER